MMVSLCICILKLIFFQNNNNNNNDNDFGSVQANTNDVAVSNNYMVFYIICIKMFTNLKTNSQNNSFFILIHFSSFDYPKISLRISLGLPVPVGNRDEPDIQPDIGYKKARFPSGPLLLGKACVSNFYYIGVQLLYRLVWSRILNFFMFMFMFPACSTMGSQIMF